MSRGRPTDDPKQTLVAVRLAARQMRALEARAKREGVGLSEALRRCVDEWASSSPSRRTSEPPPASHQRDETFDGLRRVPNQAPAADRLAHEMRTTADFTHVPGLFRYR
jgi:hypothetical protein